MTIAELCDLFDGAWSELPIRFFIDGEEIAVESGPEQKDEPNDGPPDHYEIYFTRTEAA